MARSVFLLLWFVVVWMFSAPRMLILGQKGFMSIDCGAQSDNHDSDLGIDYNADDVFTDSGNKMNVASDFMSLGLQPTTFTLRAFPKGTRNCYTIPLITTTTTDEVSRRYLIRAFFFYGNYDRLKNAPKFDLHVGVNYWTTIGPLAPEDYVYQEIVYAVPPAEDAIQVCLVKTGYGNPFISSLELRQLSNTMYPAADQFQALALLWRLDVGGRSNDSVFRYPQDTYDRFWNVDDLAYSSADKSLLWNGSSIRDPLDRTNDSYKVPTSVLATVATTQSTIVSLRYQWAQGTLKPPYSRWIAYFHFAEMEKPESPRNFTIYCNDISVRTISLDYLEPVTVPTDQFTSDSGSFSYEIASNSSSIFSAPPILNALELYHLLNLSTTPTFPDDVNAMKDVKKVYGVTKDSWQGDPCVPTNLTWEGVTCNTDNPPRIISVNLTSSGLKGNIADSLANLTELKHLDLSDNQLTGSLPEFLATLPNLTTLDLSRNSLSGSVPKDLQTKQANGLDLRVDENPKLCTSGSCGMSKTVKYTIAGLAVWIVFGTASAIQLWITKRNKKKAQRRQNMEVPGVLSSKLRYTRAEVAIITSNFKTIIGKGGFGEVFLGELSDGTKVAVKRFYKLSIHSTESFKREAKVMLSIYSHKNLVRLRGYCEDAGAQALIYDYATNGNLYEHLSGKKNNPLSWDQRLNIAIDIANGLYFVHNNCHEGIIHRDIKPANILLDRMFVAKISDFGLAREFSNKNGDLIAASPAGTPGYLDPEYKRTKIFNRKSDIYSFGIVLLELITGKFVVNDSELVNWVIKQSEKENYQELIIDRSLGNEYDDYSVNELVKTAISCVKQAFEERPDIAKVLQELNNCHRVYQSSLNRPNDEKGSSTNKVEVTPLSSSSANIINISESSGSYNSSSTHEENHEEIRSQMAGINVIQSSVSLPSRQV